MNSLACSFGGIRFKAHGSGDKLYIDAGTFRNILDSNKVEIILYAQGERAVAAEGEIIPATEIVNTYSQSALLYDVTRNVFRFHSRNPYLIYEIREIRFEQQVRIKELLKLIWDNVEELRVIQEKMDVCQHGDARHWQVAKTFPGSKITLTCKIDPPKQ